MPQQAARLWEKRGQVLRSSIRRRDRHGGRGSRRLGSTVIRRKSSWPAKRAGLPVA